ncbi:MAG: hypothetical protein KDB37_14250 [Ilumatobacter sp.]|nr:hypothetical protein [Ilumatobacter sp.]
MLHTINVKPPQTADLRPDDYAILRLGTDLTDQFSVDGSPRFPSPAQWFPELGLDIFNSGHQMTITQTAGVIDDEIAAEVLDDGLTNPSLQTAQPFKYQVWQRRAAGDADAAEVREAARRSLSRATDLAFSAATLAAIEAADTALTGWVGEMLSATGAMGALEDALLSLGIYGGTIHLPAYFAPYLWRDRVPTVTPFGTRIHLFPSVAAGVAGKAYATGPVWFGKVTEQSYVFKTLDQAVHADNNVHQASATLFGIVGFDEAPVLAVDVVQPSDFGLTGW